MRRVVYEQYWPWQVLAELPQDLAAGFSDPARPLNEEIKYILSLGYRPEIQVQDHMAACYTTVCYTFWIQPQDFTMLILRFPQSRTTHPV